MMRKTKDDLLKGDYFHSEVCAYLADANKTIKKHLLIITMMNR